MLTLFNSSYISSMVSMPTYIENKSFKYELTIEKFANTKIGLIDFKIAKLVETSFYGKCKRFYLKFSSSVYCMSSTAIFQYSRLRLYEGTGQEETSLLGTNIFNVTYVVFTY